MSDIGPQALGKDRRAALWLAIAGSVLFAILGLVLYPFAGEDTTVLFHRANHSDLPLPFHYLGYISLGPQVVSVVVSPLPPVVQAALYAAISALIWGYMLALCLRIGPPTLILFAVIAYVFVFDPFYVFNLTYSLWPSVVILGLVATLALIERRPLRGVETGIVVVLSASSPLSLFMAIPLVAVLRHHPRHAGNWIALLACLLSYPLLTDHGAHQVGSLSTLVLDRLAEVVRDPQTIFDIRGDRLPISPPGLVRAGSLAFVLIFLPLALLPPVRRRYGMFWPLALACAGIFLAAFTRLDPGQTLASRYYVPVIFAATVIAARIWADLSAGRGSRALRLSLYTLILAAALVQAVREHRDPQRALSEFRSLMTYRAGDPPVYFQRPGHFNPNDWTLALGRFDFDQSDCGPGSRDLAFRFQFYCDGRQGVIQVTD